LIGGVIRRNPALETIIVHLIEATQVSQGHGSDGRKMKTLEQASPLLQQKSSAAPKFSSLQNQIWLLNQGLIGLTFRSDL
jgi:hypothetical protein